MPLLAGGVAGAVMLALALLAPAPWRQSIIAQAEDAVMRLAAPLMTPAPPGPEVIVIDIDAETLAQVGAWPWPRETLAALVERLNTHKPAALALDMLLAGADPRSPIEELKRRGVSLGEAMRPLTEALPDGDAALAKALEAAPAVLGLVLHPSAAGRVPSAHLLTRGAAQLVPAWRGAGVMGPHAPLMTAASGLGVSALPGDSDGVIRRLALFVEAGGAPYPGLALETLRVWQDTSGYLVEGPPDAVLVGTLRLPLPHDALLRLLPPSALRTPIRQISAQAVLRGEAPFAPGALVLIGGSAPELGGLRNAQDDALEPAVMLQARGLAQLLAGRVPLAPPRPDGVQGALLVLAAGLGLAAALRLGPVAGLLALAGGLVMLLALPVLLFAGTGMLIAPVLAAGVGVAAYAGAALVAYLAARKRAARLRQRFEQHLAPQVVSMILANPGLIKLRGERREITALFTDVEDFTAMTERATPEALVGVLDDYFEGVAEILVRHGGMIDKIVGDAVHAFFNAPLDLPDHPAHALAAAREILRWSEAFRTRPGPAALGFGRTRIGLETGPAIVGDVGLRAKLDYTAHGAVVNAAARLEAANKQFGSSICLGPGIAQRLAPGLLRPLGTITLRGMRGEAQVFEPAPDTGGPDITL